MKLSFKSQSLTGGLKISKAQQATLKIVGVTAVVLGAGLVLIIDFFKYIDFNNTVIEKQGEAISGYSKSIKNSGACKAPRSGDYTQDELKNCNPNETKTKDVAGTLRATIMDDASSDIGLESIARTSLSVCFDPETKEPYSSAELKDKYMNAETTNDRRYYMNAIKICSALRVIPDALPIGMNREAVLGSLNQIYIDSDWSPSSIAPANSSSKSSFEGLSSIPVSFNNENENVSFDQIKKLLGNISKSIRYFNVISIRLEIPDKGGDVKFSGSAEAYYTNNVESSETTETVTAKNVKGGK